MRNTGSQGGSKKLNHMSVNKPPRGNYKVMGSVEKIASITCVKRKKRMVYSYLPIFTFFF